jgi:hypothetical protein
MSWSKLPPLILERMVCLPSGRGPIFTQSPAATSRYDPGASRPFCGTFAVKNGVAARSRRSPPTDLPSTLTLTSALRGALRSGLR